MSVGTDVRCGSCGELTPAGRFCIHCGASTQQACPACGASVVPGAKFCLECGTALNGGASRAAGDASPSSPAPVAERRLVSVLFADLVGFTTLSEHRDPEAVRELLSRYFDRCRTLIERYGGTVEKFIGDAVMAVWGTPVAREDDAERAVRAALSLTQAVTLLGEEVGMPELRVRAGVLTGNAAVEVGAEGEGMVLGDTVNTASRLQSIAEPGTVLVDDVTRRSSEAAIAYEDAGSHEVKGREQPVRAWTALRVVAGTGGARRSAGLEAPFVGREHELELIIEAFEESAAARQARLVTVIGDAGVGKSRLLWEFWKYVDGVEKIIRWHQGRCLAYGEGVSYWALAEMVRSRAGIIEEEDPASARTKLHAAVDEFISDERERRLVEPRLAHLLGLEQRTATDRADLFSGWRLFFERIAAAEPVVLVFEDLQWADSGLLDFIDYLLEWSGEHPIFILALGRPELLTERPEWPVTIRLPVLGDEAMDALLAGLIPGAPPALSEQIRARAEGFPLYAVETVRMLVDRAALRQEGNRYVVTGTVENLEVPETLQALVAARLDNLEVAERTLLQDAAVIGQSFTPATLIAVSGRPAGDVKPLLESLVAKQLLSFTDDVRSAERGQYSFLQGLLRTVALSTLSRRDRKAKHLAVAHHLETAWGEEAGDIAEVLASHYLDAVEAEPEAEDAGTIRAAACRTLEEAGRRAISLALGPEARRHFEHAAELTSDPEHRGRLLREAGSAAFSSGELSDALNILEAAAAVLSEAGAARELARVNGLMGTLLVEANQAERAADLLARAHGELSHSDDPEALAEVVAVRARVAFLAGRLDEALALVDLALPIAEGRRLTSPLLNALTTKANVLSEKGRPVESTALLQHALGLAVEHELGRDAVRGFYNLAENLMAEARFADAEDVLGRGLAFARRRGDRQGERWLVAQAGPLKFVLGRFDETLRDAAELLARQNDQWALQSQYILPHIYAAQGDKSGMQEIADSIRSPAGWSETDLIARVSRAIIQRELGQAAAGVDDARTGAIGLMDLSVSFAPLVLGESVECALAADRPDIVQELLDHLDGLEPVQCLPLLDAEAARARALLAAQREDREQASQWFRRAIDLFRELDTPFYRARAQLQYAEFLGPSEEAEAAREEAMSTFETVGAEPWLERARAIGPAVRA
jgi:class 3 adenylate cyclase/tetratricopeptide (TPR) repeat protein